MFPPPFLSASLLMSACPDDASHAVPLSCEFFTQDESIHGNESGAALVELSSIHQNRLGRHEARLVRGQIYIDGRDFRRNGLPSQRHVVANGFGLLVQTSEVGDGRTVEFRIHPAGQTVLTRMEYGASSRASPVPKAIIAPLEAA